MTILTKFGIRVAVVFCFWRICFGLSCGPDDLANFTVVMRYFNNDPELKGNLFGMKLTRGDDGSVASSLTQVDVPEAVKKHLVSRLNPRIRIPHNHDLDREFVGQLDDNAWDGWLKLRKVHPHAAGIIDLSLPGYNDQRTLALIYAVREWNITFAQAYLFITVKTKRGWQIRKILRAWKS